MLGLARGAVSGAVSLASGVVSTLVTAPLAAVVGHRPAGGAASSDGGGGIGDVRSLSDDTGAIDLLAVADLFSNGLNSTVAATASALGFPLNFTVHETGSAAILITGAGHTPVGAHATRTLVALGYTVVAGVSCAADGERLVARCEKDGSKGRCVPLVLDVTSPDSLRSAYEFVCEVLLVDPEDPTQNASSNASVNAQSPQVKAPEILMSQDGMRRRPNARGPSRLGIEAPITATSEIEVENDAVKDAASDQRLLLVGLVNCDGTQSPGPMELLPLSEMLRAYEVNTAGAVAVTQAMLPLLRISKGRIINVCSSAGVTAAPINGSYAASKMALEAVSDSLRVELYQFGISVSIIEPGSMDAEAWSPSSSTAKSAVDTTRSHQLLRPMTPISPNTDTTPYTSTSPSSSQQMLPPTPTSPVQHSRPMSPPRHMQFNGGLSLRPMTDGPSPLRSLSPPQAISPPPNNRRPAPPRSWSSLSNHPLTHDHDPISPTEDYANSWASHGRSLPHQELVQHRSHQLQPHQLQQLQQQRRASVHTHHHQLRSSSPSLIPISSRAAQERRISLSRHRSPLPVQRRSLTPQPSALPNRMYTAPSADPANGGRSLRRHPVWDAADREEVQSRLYGPLIATVRELAESASGETNGDASDPAAKHALPSDASGNGLRGTSRAIVHALTAPYPKTRYRVGWDARATAYLRWALPDRVLDWGFAALSGGQRKDEDDSSRGRSSSTPATAKTHAKNAKLKVSN